MRRILLTLAAIGCLARPAGALDLLLGAETDMWFDDNVYGTSTREVSDFSWAIAPTVGVSERWRRLSAELNVRPSYELYFDQDRLSGFNYDADGSLEWQPTERLSLGITDQFMRNRTLRGLNVQEAPGREPFINNVAQFSVAYRTSPLGTLQLSAAHNLWDFSERTRNDQSSTSAALHYHRLVTKRSRVGGRFSFARQSFDRVTGRSDTDYFNSSFTFSFVPAETFRFDASAGPTRIHQPDINVVLPQFTRANLIRVNSSGTPLVGQLGTCPELPNGLVFDGPGCVFSAFPFPAFLRLSDPIPFIGTLPQAGGDSWTYFADVSAEKEWDKGSLSASYRRDQGSGSAIGFSSISDTVEISGSYMFWRRLSLTATAVWENREESGRQLSPGRVKTVLDTLPATPTLPAVNNLVPVGLAVPKQSDRVRSFNASVGGHYALDERSSLSALVGFTDQSASYSSSFGDMNRFYIKLSFDYEFEPFRW